MFAGGRSDTTMLPVLARNVKRRVEYETGPDLIRLAPKIFIFSSIDHHMHDLTSSASSLLVAAVVRGDAGILPLAQAVCA